MQNNQPTPTTCGVTSYTWGSHDYRINGMGGALDTLFFGGNVGHAAGKIVIPVNEQTTALIAKYCTSPKIPYEKVKRVTKKAIQSENGIVKGDENAFEEEVYMINWSYWPNGDEPYHLVKDNNHDGHNERPGVDKKLNPKFEGALKQEQRYHAGIFGKRLMNYGETGIIHKRDLADYKFNYLRARVAVDMNDSLVNSIQTLCDKLIFRDGDAKNPINLSKLTDTEILLVQRFLGNDVVATYAKKPLTKDTLEQLQSLAMDKSREIEARFERAQNILERLEQPISAEYPEPAELDNVSKQLVVAKNLNEKLNILEQLSSVYGEDEALPFTPEYCSALLRAIPGINIYDYLNREGINFSLPQANLAPLKALAQERLNHLYVELVKHTPELDQFKQRTFEEYYTRGHAPDHQVSLPLDNNLGVTNGHEYGLNVEAMLKEMHTIAVEGETGNGFDITNNNCSVTWLRILKAGAKTQHLRNQFDKKALGAVGNPQMVHNNTTAFLKELARPEDSAMNRFRDVDIIGKITGFATKTLLDPEASTVKKAAAGMIVAPSYAAAGLWHGAKKLGSMVKGGFKSFFGKVKSAFSKPAQSNVEDHIDLTEQDKAIIERGQAATKAIEFAQIHSKNVDDALSQFKTQLEQTQNVVVFDASTQKLVDRSIERTKDVAKKQALTTLYQDLCQRSIARANQQQNQNYKARLKLK